MCIRDSPEPQTLNEEENTEVLAFCKSRGSYKSKEDAEAAVADIIRNHDSENVNLVVKMGGWFPVVRGKKSMGGGMVDRDDVTYITDAESDTQELNKIHSVLSKKNSDKNSKLAKDVLERREALEREQIEEAAKEDSLDNYIRRRNVENALRDAISTSEKQLEDLHEKYFNNMVYLKSVEVLHPEYIAPPEVEWIESLSSTSVDTEEEGSSSTVAGSMADDSDFGDEMWLYKFNLDRKKAGIPRFVVMEDAYIMMDEVAERISPELIELGKNDLAAALRGELDYE